MRTLTGSDRRGLLRIRSAGICRLLAMLVACLPIALHSQAMFADDPANARTAQVQFFESKIRPLLVEHCVRCHGEKKQESELRLDTWDGISKGGLGGPIVVAEKPEASLLITAVGYQDNNLQMPPDKKLSPQQVKDLTEWVKLGMPHPDKDTSAESTAVPQAGWEDRKKLWSLQPVNVPAIPSVKSPEWPANPIDHFILAGLEAKGLTPARPADKRTLLRRVTFDLIGLPPTPAEIEAFLRDDSPKAYETVIERLLASPHYGERWGRHWLDVARYADSNGLDENIALGNAWRYRDYVIAAFNKDKPYDRFLTEQIAGDLLPADDQTTRFECLVATGFLSLGPKVLAEPDPIKMQMDIIDEQIDTLGRSVLGLTLGCARCHDHKFDPVRTDDYYALAGIFKSTRTMENFKIVARWHENSILTDDDRARLDDLNRRIAAQKELLQTRVTDANAKLVASKTATEPEFKLPEKPETLYPAETQAELKTLRDQIAELEKSTQDFPSALGVTESTSEDVAVHLRGSHLTLGRVVPRGFPEVIRTVSQPIPIAEKSSGRLELVKWLVDPRHPLTSRVMVNRVWRWHFGKGLARSPDNFGRMGDAPDHPALLDWLADRFIRDGWSIKQLHRLILLSRTYQMSSEYSSQSAAIDPENFLLWRMNVRRLEAEAIRDSLLAVSGTLDPKMGGSLLHVKNREFLFNHTSQDGTKYDSRQRSVYLPVVRNNLYDVFALFDFTDATVLNGDRSTSTIAPQALFWMNSDLVLASADALAERIMSQPQHSVAERVQTVYQILFGHPATDAEIARSQQFLTGLESAGDVASSPESLSRAAWAGLCRVLLASNEFAYVK